jgi:tetratricopeptide (TPR) repeat protein
MLNMLKARLNAELNAASLHGERGRGDKARDRGDCQAAGDAYEAYLQAFPKDFDVWVQLGHMRKDTGAYQAAEKAYGRAHRLRADDADLLLNLGHLSKLQGKFEQAAEYYVGSVRLMPHGPALAELSSDWLPHDVRERVLERVEKMTLPPARLSSALRMVPRSVQHAGSI